jgi:hypothetical protein
MLCLKMGAADLLDCIFLCLVIHLLEDFCEGLSSVCGGRTRLTAKTSLVWSSADVQKEDAIQLAYLESIFFDVCHCFLSV